MEALYQDPKLGFCSKKNFFHNLINNGYDVIYNEVKEFFKTLTEEQIHSNRKQYYLPIRVPKPLDQFQIDLIFVVVKKKTEYNNALLHYILTCIDCFSRKADAVYIKNKRAPTVLEAFKGIEKRLGTPKEIHCDKGSEFMGVFWDYCKKKGIKLTMTDGEGKLSNGKIERFNRTLLGYIKRYKVKNRNSCEEILPDIMTQYNNTIHSSIKDTPNNAFCKQKVVEYRNVLTPKQYLRLQFKVGDLVRVKKPITIYTKKGRAEKYSRKIFKIIEKKGNQYKLNDPGLEYHSYNSLLLCDAPLIEEGLKEPEEPEEKDFDKLSEEEIDQLRKKYRFPPKKDKELVIYNKIWNYA